MKRATFVVMLAGVLLAPVADADPAGTAAPLPDRIEAYTYTSDVHALHRQNQMLAEFVLTATDGDHHVQALGIGIGRGMPVFRNEPKDSTGCDWTWLGVREDLIKCYRDITFPASFRLGMYSAELHKQRDGTVLSGPPPNVPPAEIVSAAANTTEDCKASACTIKLPPIPAGHQFVLSGFSLARVKGEAFVRRVSIQPVAGKPEVVVRFNDNGTPPYRASVWGLYLPDRVFKERKKLSFTYQPGQTPPKASIGSDVFSLVGIDFEFLNGDHKLRTIGVRYDRPYLTPVFADQNTDDPWHVEVEYVTFK